MKKEEEEYGSKVERELKGNILRKKRQKNMICE